MKEIKTRFKKGDVVFLADSVYEEKWVSCPDCLGTLTWLVVFADDSSEQVPCVTCSRGYEPPTGRIGYKEWRPLVRKVTIGSIRYDDTNEHPFSYMCQETGIGSGRIYYDKDLFTDEELALKNAQEKNEMRMKDIAKNNFSKRFGGTKDIESALSTWGFSRRMQLEKARLFRQWANLAKLI